MEGGDFSSASELDHFKDVGAQIEKRIKERGGAAFLALSMGEHAISRDFAVLQIAHILAQHGRSVLIADCDFLHPGLSGLVENIEEHGFLDLLLYGSSLKTVARSAGIDGVSVTGAGSFPVSRTIPFALKEFEKIREFLRTKHDVVIYCSTLYTEDAKMNPLMTLVDGIVICCRIEDMPEGELQKNLKALGAERTPPVELVCFCGKREQAAPAKAPERKLEAQAITVAKEAPGAQEERLAAPVIKRTAGVKPIEPRKKPRVNILRIAPIAVAVLIVAFIVWWIVINRTVGERGRQDTTPRTAAEKTDTGTAAQGAPVVAPVESVGSSAASDTLRKLSPSEEEQRAAAPSAATVTRTPPAERKAPDTLAARLPAGPAVYTIHVASFKEMSRAEIEKAYLEKNGFAARIVEVDINGEHWLRILVGEYATMDEATKARLELLGLSKIGYARIATIGSASR